MQRKHRPLGVGHTHGLWVHHESPVQMTRGRQYPRRRLSYKGPSLSTKDLTFQGQKSAPCTCCSSSPEPYRPQVLSRAGRTSSVGAMMIWEMSSKNSMCTELLLPAAYWSRHSHTTSDLILTLLTGLWHTYPDSAGQETGTQRF